MGISVGVGQSLVPLMVTESFFLHQRATCLSYSGAINSMFGLVWGMFVPNVVGAIGWRNLYYVVSGNKFSNIPLSPVLTVKNSLQDAGIAGSAFLCGIFLMPETQYDRPLEAYNGLGYGKTLPSIQPEIDDEKEYARDKRAEDVHVEHVDQQDDSPGLIQITNLTRPDVDNVNFKPRTWLTDLRPFQRKPNYKLGLTTFKHALQLVSWPHIILEAFKGLTLANRSCFSPMSCCSAQSTFGS